MSDVRRPNYRSRVKDMREQEQMQEQRAKEDALSEQAHHAKRNSKQTLASQLLKKAQKASAGKKPQKTQKPQKPQKAKHAHAHLHDGHEEHVAEMEHLASTVEGIEDEVHRRKHAEELMGELVAEEEEEQEVKEHEDLRDTHATGADAVTRSQGDSAGDDGFDGRQQQREAYDRWLRGNVRADQERFDELRRRGARDDFNPELSPAQVEALGATKATAHVVRIYEKWTLEGASREESMQKAAALLAGFANIVNIRKVLAQLESKPIRDVYPLEVMLRMLDERPELLPGVRPGTIIGNAAELVDGKLVAGVPFTITLPPDVRLKSFALLGGARPGYEFHPHPTQEGKYTLLVDTPGRYRFAVLAAPLQQLGRIQRETTEAILEVFACVVFAMGKKGEPLTPEAWEQLELDGANDDDDALDDADLEASDEGEPLPDVELAPNLAVQIRRALELIAKDAESTSTATTYSWRTALFKPGAPVDGEPILRLSVERAGPFDAAWVKAREAITQKQKELEPGRAVVTAEDFTAALRRARVR